ncbi:MAG: phosphatidylserine decarboxylase [Verrucomicrobiales bacterium]|jgi:phosphatidylserine decarboxylase
MKIQFYNRYTDEIETEVVYGEKWLRWTYESLPGRAALYALAKRAWFSRLYGWRMSRPGSRERVAPFVEKYGLEAGEFDELDSFGSFNEFFYRKLKPGARPIDQNEDSIVFPADGRHLGFPNLAECEGFFVKGQKLDLANLLGSTGLAERYQNGSAVLSRLCPVDYHRFHFCADGTPGEPRLINGPLYSVSPIALRRNLSYLAENKRVLTEHQTERFGTVLILEIGATNVGSIKQSFTPQQLLAKGDEKGWFEFGGSATMTLFEPGQIQLADDLIEHSSQQRETYAKMGDRMGMKNNA